MQLRRNRGGEKRKAGKVECMHRQARTGTDGTGTGVSNMALILLKELGSRLLRVISAKLTQSLVSYTDIFTSVHKYHGGHLFRRYNISLGSYSESNGGDGVWIHNLVIISPML